MIHLLATYCDNFVTESELPTESKPVRPTSSPGKPSRPLHPASSKSSKPTGSSSKPAKERTHHAKPVGASSESTRGGASSESARGTESVGSVDLLGSIDNSVQPESYSAPAVNVIVEQAEVYPNQSITTIPSNLDLLMGTVSDGELVSEFKGQSRGSGMQLAC